MTSAGGVELGRVCHAAAVPATIVNWGSDEIVSVREWTEYLGGIAGIEPTFVEETHTIPSACVDTARLHEIAPLCQVGWQEGFARLAASALA